MNGRSDLSYLSNVLFRSIDLICPIGIRMNIVMSQIIRVPISQFVEIVVRNVTVINNLCDWLTS